MNQNTARWYVVRTQPHAEARANEHLLRQGFTTYLPRLLKQRRHARKTDTVSRPLFPGYMFVLIDHTHQGWHVIRSTFGVANLIGGGNGPVPVRAEIIEALRAQEGDDGYFRVAARKFTHGAAVRVVDGIFASAIGLFESMSDKDRVSVLLDLLGRRVRVVLEAESIAAA
ncbi:MAG: transcriptional activator RfaH [Alphaproteobacteria bacterium]|nr:transcriptional activator RfaH [Alphaproteobacteria bacterium]